VDRNEDVHKGEYLGQWHGEGGKVSGCIELRLYEMYIPESGTR